MIGDNITKLFNRHLSELVQVLDKPVKRAVVALSGGLDSVVLLHLLNQYQQQNPSFQVLAHNVNHGLSKNAEAWGVFCACLCVQWNIDFIASKVSLQKLPRTSLEALARDARYASFKEKMRENDIILTGHHQDDQLETVLLALKRGSGSTGLQGIRSYHSFDKGYLLRPLLIFSRQQLADYAELHQLDWIEDESNQDEQFDRNFIRQTISPLLKQRWPAIAKSVSRTAQLCQEQQILLDEVAQADLQVCSRDSLSNETLDIEALRLLSDSRRNNLLRFWFKSHQLHYPSAKQLSVLWYEIALSERDKQPLLQLGHISIRRYMGLLYIVPEQPICLPDLAKKWSGEKVLWLVQDQLGIDFSLVESLYAQQHDVRVCLRQHLDAQLTCCPEGRNKARGIKKLLHEYNVAPWLRDQVLFVFVDQQLIEAVGLWHCQVKTDLNIKLMR